MSTQLANMRGCGPHADILDRLEWALRWAKAHGHDDSAVLRRIHVNVRMASEALAHPIAGTLLREAMELAEGLNREAAP